MPDEPFCLLERAVRYRQRLRSRSEQRIHYAITSAAGAHDEHALTVNCEIKIFLKVSDETDAVSVVTGAFPVMKMDGIDGAGLQRATRMSVHKLPRLIFEWQRDVDT